MQVDRTPMRKSPDVKDNIYDLVLFGYETRAMTYEGKTSDRKVWEYVIQGQDRDTHGSFIFITGVSRGDKVLELLAAHGVVVEDGKATDFDESKLIGTVVKGLVQKKPSKNGKAYSRIVSLLAKEAA